LTKIKLLANENAANELEILLDLEAPKIERQEK